MGCDIHAYVEAWKGDELPTSPYRFSMIPRMNLGRHYDMFSRLANVRGKHPNAIPPRGLPDVVGWVVDEDDTYYVSKEGEGDRLCSLEQAESWIKSGCSKVKFTGEDGCVVTVSDPDNHSHSWMTPEEWNAAIEDVERKREFPLTVEYHIISDILAAYQKRGYGCRVVFWFDN